MDDTDGKARGRPRSDTARRAILDAAYDLVVTHGYADVTMDAIAAQAGTGKQTIYRWWPGKADLVLDALEDWAEGRITITETESLPAFLTEVCEGATRAGPVLRSLMAQAQFDTALRDKVKARLIEPRRDALRRCLAHAGVEARHRDGLVFAIYGALWYRLLMDEPLDAPFVRQMTALARRG
ncbi:TetR/AcrR family transcriptional regulator [Bradyrhizobium sp. 2TAF24]|uniref:TetR/AcrR family transcriptional regulator n=1 Tax=Bradyrhizobium sp. 2TAF24 TaxID=3233011 RepID=UPI003F93D2C7